MSSTGQQAGRTRNRRGEGGLLRDEIVGAAERLLEREGAEDAITLRSVAREAGIAAPSIYSHFADREAIIDAVLDLAFERLARLINEATATEADPVATLLAGCHAYVNFALTDPARYRVLFGRVRRADATSWQRASLAELPEVWQRRLGAFKIPDAIARCVAEGRSDSTNPFVDGTTLWTALHGAVLLRQFIPGFPWPPLPETVDDLVRRIARIHP